MATSTYYKVPTVRVRRHRRVAWEIRGESWQYGYVLVKVKWPTYAVPSKWYLLGENNQKIYLKEGWNTFGRDSTRSFQFKDSTITCPVNLSVGVPKNGSTPMVHNFGSSCYFDGQFLSMSRQLNHLSTVTLFCGGTAIVMKFGKDQN